MSGRTFLCADLFCGAGGTSTGAQRALERRGHVLELVAVNHWDKAIATHAKNHPRARHYCVNLDTADPERLVPEGYLDLLMASPECVHHSRARGGKPVNDQRRADAWLVNRWLTRLDVAAVLIENVPEFVEWGPTDRQGRPIKEKKRLYFEAWVRSLWELGYAVDFRVLNCADYGDATTRKRLFLIARKDGLPIRWPEPTHSRTGSADMFGGLKRWRAAREVIDWQHPGASILGRKKPLSCKTRLRVARGLKKYGGMFAGDFIDLLDLPRTREQAALELRANPAYKSARAKGDAAALRAMEDALLAAVDSVYQGAPEPAGEVLPFVVNQRDSWDGERVVPGRPRDLEEPLFSVTGSSRPCVASGRVVPFKASKRPEPIVLGQHGGGEARGVDDPLPTITQDGAIAAVQPMLAPYYGNGHASPIDAPVPTLTGKGRHALVDPEALAVPYGPRAEATPVSDPLGTITTKDRFAVADPTAEPFVVEGGHTHAAGPGVRSIDQPLPTISAGGHKGLAHAEAEPFVLSRHSYPEPRSADAPLHTVTGSGGGGVVDPQAFLLTRRGHSDPANRPRPVSEPVPTIVASETGKAYLAAPEAFVVPNFGEHAAQLPRVHDVGEPVPAVTSRGAGNLVEPSIDLAAHLLGVDLERLAARVKGDWRRVKVVGGRIYVLDIRYRMLKNRELARAMSFDEESEYAFVGNQGEVTAQIGNAVPCATAEALVTSVLLAGAAALPSERTA